MTVSRSTANKRLILGSAASAAASGLLGVYVGMARAEAHIENLERRLGSVEAVQQERYSVVAEMNARIGRLEGSLAAFHSQNGPE